MPALQNIYLVCLLRAQMSRPDKAKQLALLAKAQLVTPAKPKPAMQVL